MKHFKTIIAILTIILSYNIATPCTSAIISAKVTKNGRPLLWKHRDTGEENNKVEYIAAKNGKMAYVGLFNASDTKNKEAWMGMNTSGFAIMNTASYNLKDDDVKEMDKEGVIMAEALGVCKTVDDFENFLSTHKKPLGVEANFGVIDANGNGAYFETNNTTFTRYNLEDAPNGILVRANYSHSGRSEEGYGFVREATANSLLLPYVLSKNVEPITFTEEISRSFYHSLYHKDFALIDEEWLIDQDFIPRNISTASCVIEGIKPGEDPKNTIMWISLGYPPCSELRAVFMAPNGVPDELKGTLPNGHSPLCDEVVARKYEVFPIRKGNGNRYINIKKLYNKANTGYAQKYKAINLEYYKNMCAEIEKCRVK